MTVPNDKSPSSYIRAMGLDHFLDSFYSERGGSRKFHEMIDGGASNYAIGRQFVRTNTAVRKWRKVWEKESGR